jgi:hypothetical protein
MEYQEHPTDLFLRNSLDDVCRLALRTAKADIACIVSWQNKKEAILRGAVGCNLHKLSGDMHLPNFDPDELQISIFTNLEREAWFAKHPMRLIAPLAKGLLLLSLGHTPYFGDIVLLVFNPKISANQSTSSLASLSELSRIAQALLRGRNEGTLSRAKEVMGFSEESPSFETNDPLYSFLSMTLTNTRKLATRKSVSFVSLRTWKKSIKDSQIAALRSMKQRTSDLAIRQISIEIAEATLLLHGPKAFEAVVPIPCGSSGKIRCLSVEIAEATAKLLEIPFIEILENVVPVGSSHPRKSAKLNNYSVKETNFTKLLLLDDVATTGTHIEYAMNALRKVDKKPTAMVWIGG